MNKHFQPFSDEQLILIDKITNGQSPEKLAWLSGYLWGLVEQNSTSKDLASNHSAIESVTQQKKISITVVSASQTGNAKRVAQSLAKALCDQAFSVTVVSAADYKFKKITQESFLIVVTSTQGEGEPPEEAISFFKYLESAKAPKLSQLNFAVLGLGDSSYTYFCQAGKTLYKRLNELGAIPILDRFDADVDFQSVSEEFQDQLIAKLAKYKDSTQNLEQSDTSDKSTLNSLHSSQYNRDNPYFAEVLTNQKITSRSSDRDIRHLEFDLADSGLSYEPGDTLGVWYQNSTDLVDELLANLNLDGELPIKLKNQTFSLKQALIEKFELTQNTVKIVTQYAELSNNDKLKKLIEDKNAVISLAKSMPIVDLIASYPSSLSAEQFLSLLRPLTPRFYSISSAQDEVGEEVHLTVGLVNYQINGKERFGGASNYLTNISENKDKVGIFIENNPQFKLPTDSSKPIIMISAGTGIAPFRSFMQQRDADNSTGKNWLIFGNPHFLDDFLYQTEWQSYVKNEKLNKIDLAWSRDQATKIYVQNKLEEKADEVWKWIQEGAYLYLCGDANTIAKSVHNTLLAIIKEQGKLDEQDAIEYLDKLRADKRYQKDVY